MEQTLVIVLIVAAVAVATMYLMRSRKRGAAQASAPAQPEAPKPQPAPPAPAAPAEATAPAAAAPVPTVEIDDETAVLKKGAIELHGTATSKDEAIAEAGRLLVEVGAVGQNYVDSMFERERSVSTYMGNLLAIPHGTNEAMATIAASAISLVRYPNVLEWNGNPVKFVIGIAASRGEHLELLGRIAEVFLDESKVAVLEQATTAAEIQAALVKVNG